MLRHCFRAVTATSLAVSLLVGSWPGHAGAPPTSASSKPINLVLIVLDGARPAYIKVSHLPHLQSLIHRGTQFDNAWAGILESETPSGHATIATGSEPRADGILSFGWANASRNVVNLFDPVRIRGGAMEQLIKASGAPTIASLVHAQAPGASVAALSGYKYYAADALGGPYADAIMYYGGRQGGFGPVAIPGHVPPQTVLDGPSLTVKTGNGLPVGQGDHLAMRLAARTFRKMHPRALLINLPEFDYPLGHVWGGGRDWKDVTTLMRGFDSDLAMLESNYKRAHMLKHTIFVITADHGMSPTYYHVSRGVITDAASRAGVGILWNSYHTGSYVWLRDPSRAAEVAANIVGERNPYIQAVYYRVTRGTGSAYLRAGSSRAFLRPGVEAANQRLLATFAGPNAPDIAVQCTEGAAIAGNGQENWKADHGGSDWQSQNVPLIIAGPGVRRNYLSHFPARLEDVAPTALTLMGMSPTGMQGTPMADVFVSAPSWAAAPQAKLGKALWPVIQSLKREARAELAAHR